MLVKTFKTTLAIILAVTLCFPLSACQSNKTDSSKTTAEGYRWENFDDGSDVLSLDVPYIPSNSSSINFNVILEQGKLVDIVSAENVAVGGGLNGWSVDSVNRRDDVTLEVNASRPNGLANNGASLASVTLNAETVVLEENATESTETETQSQKQTEDKIYTGDEINEMIGVEWPTDDDSVEIVNKDVSATSAETDQIVADTLEEVEALVKEIENGNVKSEDDLKAYEEKENAENNEENTDSDEDEETLEKYEVYAVFANPALTVNFDKSEIKNNTYKATIEASDFALNTNLTKDSFKLENAEGCNISEVKCVDEKGFEIKISLPSSEDHSALNDAKLILKGDSNESEADVVCLIEIPESWIDLKFDYADTSAETVTFSAELNDAKGELTKDNLSLKVNGNDLEPTSVSTNDDGTYSVTVNSNSVSDGSVVTADADGIKNALNKEVDVEAASAIVDLNDETRGIEKLDPSNLLPSIGKKGLVALAEFGWEKLYTNVLDPEYKTGLYDVSNNEVLSNIVNVQQQVTDLTYMVDALNNTVLVGQKASTVNNAQSLASRIRTEELQLCDQVKDIYIISDPEKREEALRKFASDKSQQVTIDNLATDLGVFYDLIMSADASTNSDLISVYDEMMALSYNWGAQTYKLRQNFRTTLASTWANGAQIVSLAYGIQTKDAEAGKTQTGVNRRSYLSTLDWETRNLSTLINETRAIGLKVYRHGGDFGNLAQYANHTDEDFDDLVYISSFSDWEYQVSESDAQTIKEEVKELRDLGAGKDPLTLYCNTTGTWIQTLIGSDTKNKWDKALVYTTGNGWTNNREFHASNPFRDYDIDIGFKMKYHPTATWDSLYLNTTQVNQLLAKLHNGQSLKQELEDIGLNTAQYLVTSDKFDCADKVLWQSNYWYFDTYEVKNATSTIKAFTKDKKHYDAETIPIEIAKLNRANWYTKPEALFVLKRVKVS